jgi:hypothetical protein
MFFTNGLRLSAHGLVFHGLVFRLGKRHWFYVICTVIVRNGGTCASSHHSKLSSVLCVVYCSIVVTTELPTDESYYTVYR